MREAEGIKSALVRFWRSLSRDLSEGKVLILVLGFVLTWPK